MVPALDQVRIQAVIDQLAPLESQAVYGVFDPTRIPTLSFESFDGVGRISAAVSPDCSYRLGKQAVDSASETLDLYIYNVTTSLFVQVGPGSVRTVLVQQVFGTQPLEPGEHLLATLSYRLRAGNTQAIHRIEANNGSVQVDGMASSFRCLDAIVFGH